MKDIQLRIQIIKDITLLVFNMKKQSNLGTFMIIFFILIEKIMKDESINKLIMFDATFDDEEFIDYYINFIKSIG